MRISDWSSDVCSSDLLQLLRGGRDLGPLRRRRVLGDDRKRCGKQGEKQRAEAVCEAHGGVLRRKMRRCYRARGGDGRLSSRRVEDGVICPAGRASTEATPAGGTRESGGFRKRSEERRVGKEGGSTWRSRWWPYN